MAARTITLDFGEPRVGRWCRRCALPSGVEVDVLRIRRDGVQRVGTVELCTTGHRV